MKNIIKYTIGLPLLLIVTFSFMFLSPLFLFFDIGGYVMGVLFDGEYNFHFEFSGIGMIFDDLKEIWRPIK